MLSEIIPAPSLPSNISSFETLSSEFSSSNKLNHIVPDDIVLEILEHSSIEHSAIEHSAIEHSAIEHSVIEHSVIEHHSMEDTVERSVEMDTADQPVEIDTVERSVEMETVERSAEMETVERSVEMDECYICRQNDGDIIKPCPCSSVHYACLENFIRVGRKSARLCHICHGEYIVNFDVEMGVMEDAEVNVNGGRSDNALCYRILCGIFIGCLSCSWVYITFGLDFYVMFGNDTELTVPSSGANIYFFIFGGIASEINVIYQCGVFFKYKDRFNSEKILFPMILFNMGWSVLNQTVGYAYLCITQDNVKYFTLYNYSTGMCLTFLPIMSCFILIHVIIKLMGLI